MPIENLQKMPRLVDNTWQQTEQMLRSKPRIEPAAQSLPILTLLISTCIHNSRALEYIPAQ